MINSLMTNPLIRFVLSNGHQMFIAAVFTSTLKCLISFPNNYYSTTVSLNTGWYTNCELSSII